ncbi:MAG: DUF3820 family protein [Balneolaceae bacterium]
MYDRTFLHTLIAARMPFGRYKGRLVHTLPVHYLEWFQRTGFPPGTLGQQLATMYEIKTNGLDAILEPLLRTAGSYKERRQK